MQDLTPPADPACKAAAAIELERMPGLVCCRGDHAGSDRLDCRSRSPAATAVVRQLEDVARNDARRGSTVGRNLGRRRQEDVKAEVLRYVPGP